MKLQNWVLAAGLGFSITAIGLTAGCESHEAGAADVTSDYRTQSTMVAADAKTTTDAAKSVLESTGLKNVMGDSTAVDGTAMGEKADGTKVKVTVEKTDNGSKLSVTVGELGDPKLGAMLVDQIKAKAEGK